MKKSQNCILVILYNPDLDRLSEVFESLNGQGDLYLHFNSEVNIDLLLDRCSHNIVHRELSYKNDGIALPSNKFLNYCILEGYDYALISDQDTLYPKKYTSKILHSVPDDFCIISPAWISSSSIDRLSISTGIYYFNKFGKIDYCQSNNDEVISDVSHCISSGMFIQIRQIVDLQSFFDENLFIDWVDNDFCWNVVSHGKTIYFNPNMSLSHSLGDGHSSLLSKRYTVRNKLRNFYILRNNLYLLVSNKYPFAFWFLLKSFFKNIFSVLFLQKVGFIGFCKIIAISGSSVINNKMGKYEKNNIFRKYR